MNNQFESAAEQFLQKIGREGYENSAGLKETIDIVPIYEQYGWLFARDTVDEALKRDDPEGKQFARFAAEGYLADSLKSLSEKITNAITKATVLWQGEEIPFRRVSIAIANEADPTKRHELEKLQLQKTEEMNADRIERLQKAHALAVDLGFNSYLSMCNDFKELNLPWLLKQMGKLLDATEEAYSAEVKHYLNSLGVPEDEATPSDLAFLFRAPQFDNLFPQDKLVPSLKATLLGMGLDLDAQTNIHLDTENRPLKSPRAFCSPIQVPDEVYLVISPKGGQDDYHAILHESGHAEHLGNISPDIPWVHKRLGDGSVSESYSFLLENLLKNRLWFTEVLNQHDVDEYLRFTRFYRLWILRRYAAKLHYESLLHESSDIQSMNEQYAKHLGKALKVKVSSSNFLADTDDGLYAANYLRAWAFEVMLRKHFEKSYGELWFKSHEAGDALLAMWREGQRYSVDDLSRHIGYDGLQVDPLIEDLIA